MNRNRLLVALQERVYVHELSVRDDKTCVTLLDTVETDHNPNGLCALAQPQQQPHQCGTTGTTSGRGRLDTVAYAAIPGAEAPGSVLFYDTTAVSSVARIQAHDTAIAALAFSADGGLLATASEKGTLIRVFIVPHGTRAYSFRRGTYPSHVSSLAFSPMFPHGDLGHKCSKPMSQDDQFTTQSHGLPTGASHSSPLQPRTMFPPLLCAASASGSLHVFNLDGSHLKGAEHRSTSRGKHMRSPTGQDGASAGSSNPLGRLDWSSVGRSARDLLHAVVPGNVSETVDSSRAAVIVHIDSAQAPFVCAFATHDGSADREDTEDSGDGPLLRLQVTSDDCKFFVYRFEVSDDGLQYVLEAEHMLDSSQGFSQIARLGGKLLFAEPSSPSTSRHHHGVVPATSEAHKLEPIVEPGMEDGKASTVGGGGRPQASHDKTQDCCQRHAISQGVPGADNMSIARLNVVDDCVGCGNDTSCDADASIPSYSVGEKGADAITAFPDVHVGRISAGHEVHLSAKNGISDPGGCGPGLSGALLDEGSDGCAQGCDEPRSIVRAATAEPDEENGWKENGALDGSSIFEGSAKSSSPIDTCQETLHAHLAHGRPAELGQGGEVSKDAARDADDEEDFDCEDEIWRQSMPQIYPRKERM